jgi:hypothetical protein
MIVRSFVDWIAATLPYDPLSLAGLVESCASLTFTKPDTWSECKPHNGYKYAVNHPVGYTGMAGRADMGTHIIFPGNALQGGRVGALKTEGLFWSLFAKNARFTRIDLAIDAVDSRLSLDDLPAAYAMGEVTGAPRKWSFIHNNQGGRTLCIGSRTSERYMRVYDKASEQRSQDIAPPTDDWIRIELETKGEKAHHVGYFLNSSRDPALVARSEIQAFLDFPDNPQWQSVMAGATGTVTQSHRKLTQTQRWLLGTVATSLAAQIQADPTFLRRFIRSVRAARDQRRGL